MPSPLASSSTPRSKAAEPKALDAIALLTEDHKEVKKLFRRYEKLAKAEAGAEERGALAGQICTMLSVHAQIEEEIYYPAAKEALDETDLIDEAAVEHQSAKDLIAQIRSMTPDDELYDAKVKVLGEYIDHHVKEEQEELFPKTRRKIDIKAIGAQLQARKDELMGEAAVADDDGVH